MSTVLVHLKKKGVTRNFKEYSLNAINNVQRSDLEFRNIPVPDRFRNRQYVLFREKRKKIGPKINLFSEKS